METLLLNDGTVLDGHVLEDGEGLKLFVYLEGVSMSRGFALFSDPEKTSRIIVNNGESSKTYKGFTRLLAINNEYGNCNIMMAKG